MVTRDYFLRSMFDSIFCFCENLHILEQFGCLLGTVTNWIAFKRSGK